MAERLSDEELVSLGYYARQHCSRQWVFFLAAMFAEFEERVDPAEADQFLETLGARMARSFPLRQCESLDDLEADINAILEDIDWGWARVSESEHFIEIVHGAYPVIPQDEERCSWLAPILEGLYTEWLGEQGGDASLTARLADQQTAVGAPMLFRYGRHE
jgi:hypothetical protein